MIVTAIVWVIIGLGIVVVSVGACIVSLITKQNKFLTMDHKTKAVDLFIYLGIFITLVTSVVNILEIIFAAIDKKFFDVLSSPYMGDIYNDSMRMAIASLCVMFPLYIILSWYTTRDIKKFLYKKDILVRKIMIYISIFVTLLTMVGTLVTAIYTYLGGELTIRFELKALAVLVVALIVFGYYYYSLKRNFETGNTYIPIAIGVSSSVIVVLSILWSISIIGTPKDMRARKIDATRLADISRLQQEILNRFQTVEKIPVSLNELTNAFQGYSVPVDPLTKKEYGYKVIQQPVFSLNYVTNKKELVTPAIFELCATFEITRNINQRGESITASPIATGGIDPSFSAMNYYYEGDQSPFWNHGVGETCFKRVISAEMYYGK